MKNLSPRTDALTFISEEEWIVLWLRLRLHTWRRHYWLSEKFGWDLDSIAHQAIVDTMSGKRCWPPINHKTGKARNDVSLFSFLCQTVRSIVSHRWRKEKRKLTIEVPDPGCNPDYSDSQAGEKLLQETSFTYPQLVRPDRTESDALYRLLTTEMCALVVGDTEVLKVLQLWREDPTLKPREIAEKLELTMPQMRAAQKRLRRLLSELRED